MRWIRGENCLGVKMKNKILQGIFTMLWEWGQCFCFVWVVYSVGEWIRGR